MSRPRSGSRGASPSSRRRRSTSTSAATRLATGLGQVAVEGRLGDAHEPADLGDAVLLGAVELHRELALLGREQLRPPAEPAPRPGRAEPGLGALADEVALELGERPEHVEDQPAAARGGVERLLQAPEAGLALLEPLGERDQVLERAAEPVEAPDDQGVAGPRPLQRQREARPFGPGAADPVLVDLLAAGSR